VPGIACPIRGDDAIVDARAFGAKGRDQDGLARRAVAAVGTVKIDRRDRSDKSRIRKVREICVETILAKVAGNKYDVRA
jgi:hypothetical protein